MAWHFDASSINPQPVQATGGSFYGLGIAPKILETLNKLSFTIPTPIQHKAIPLGIEGKDLIGIAQTGTGKTLAFAIPIIQRLAQTKGRCLVLLPTRELAIQVEETFHKIAPIFGIKTAVIIGGASMGLQVQALRKNPRVIIATPGRLVDHMERCTIMMADVNVLVLDEADRMLDMGFMPSIEHILKALPRERQTLLFSATIPPEIIKIATKHMKLPINVEVAPSGTTVEKVIQELFIVRKESKRRLLEKILSQYHGSVLLFTRTKIGAKKTTRLIRDMGHKAAEIHSDRTLGQRKEALEGFKSGRYRVLVATDIASRGIDVVGIELVINYDLPEESENYVHRIGRTARAGQEGRAISFATPEQGHDVKSIEKLIKTTLPILEHPELPKEMFDYSSAQSSGFRPRYGNSFRGGGYGKKPGGHGQGRGFRHGGSSGKYGKSSERGQGQSYKPAEKREHSPGHEHTQNRGHNEKLEHSSGRDHSLRHEHTQSHDRPSQHEQKPAHNQGHKPHQGHTEDRSQSSHGRFPSNLSFAKFRRPNKRNNG